MRRMRSMAEAMLVSKSRAKRRLRPSQAKQRSTAQRRGMHGEALLVGRLADDLDGNRGGFGDTSCGIGGIGEGARDEGEAAARCAQQRHGAVTVLH